MTVETLRAWNEWLTLRAAWQSMRCTEAGMYYPAERIYSAYVGSQAAFARFVACCVKERL